MSPPHEVQALVDFLDDTCGVCVPGVSVGEVNTEVLDGRDHFHLCSLHVGGNHHLLGLLEVEDEVVVCDMSLWLMRPAATLSSANFTTVNSAVVGH